MEAGSFSVMSRRVVDIYKSVPEKNRLLSAIRAWIGFRQVGLPFERDARFHGEPRQTFMRLMRMATDGLFSFSAVPIRVATVLGLFTCSLSLLFILAVIILRLFTHLVPFTGYASLMVKMGEEGNKLQGTSLLTSTTMETVKSAEQMKQIQASQRGNSSGNSSGNSNSGGGGGLGGLIASRMGANRGGSTEQRTKTLTTTTEYLSIATSVADADLAIPAGFKLKK